jgi:hypothetical protein
MKRGKKGSHIGIMLSFGIFVTFLVFLYSILQPVIEKEQDKKLILNDLILSLVEMFDSNLTTYSSGSIKTANDSFITQINELIDSYDFDYNGLKEELKITKENEFGFSFIDDEEIEILPTKSIPISVNVYAKRIPVYYTSEEGNVFLGFIILKVW